jgi:long-chain acyl-CoA synthetase
VRVDVVTAAASELLQRRAAGGLRAAGVAAGDRVALALPAGAGVLALVLGALRRGVVPVMLDPAAPGAERAELVADCRPALVVDTPEALARLTDADPVELADVPLARPMHYTSGTTGRRKGVYSGALAESHARALLAEEVAVWGLRAEDRHLMISAAHHSAPLRFATTTLLCGGTVVLPGRFDPSRVLSAIAASRPTTAFCVPTHLKRLLAQARRDGMPPLSSFRLLAHAGEPCPEEVKRAAMAAFPAGAVHEFYGSTEGQFTVCPPTDWLERPGTVGRARPGRVLRRAGDGTLWCRAPAYAKFTYFGDPQATALAWRGQGEDREFSVGDVGRLDAEGYLYLDGRRTDLVITGGVNVYPAEVERVLARCPGVGEVAVFGVPDERWGQRLCAAVIGTATAAELDAFAHAELSAARRPKDYRLLAELPRTSTGKLDRGVLPGLLGRA